MTSPTPPRRRWFRFSLRTFFVVLTIFGVWLGVQVKWIRDRNDVFVDARDANNVFYLEDDRKQGKTPWCLKLFGEPGYIRIEIDPALSEERSADERRRLGPLFPEAEFD